MALKAEESEEKVRRRKRLLIPSPHQKRNFCSDGEAEKRKSNSNSRRKTSLHLEPKPFEVAEEDSSGGSGTGSGNLLRPSLSSNDLNKIDANKSNKRKVSAGDISNTFSSSPFFGRFRRKKKRQKSRPKEPEDENVPRECPIVLVNGEAIPENKEKKVS